MILESEVRERLASVVRGAQSLKQFAEWIEDQSWSMHKDSSPGAIELVSSIHILLSEREDRVLDDDALRRKLVSLLNNVSGSVVAGAVAPAPEPRPSASKVYWVKPAQPWSLPVSA